MVNSTSSDGTGSGTGTEAKTKTPTTKKEDSKKKLKQKLKSPRKRGSSKWEVLQSKGVKYYWNREDNTTQWTKPDDFDEAENDTGEIMTGGFNPMMGK